MTMLVLSRKEGQSFLLGDDIEVTLLEISGDKAKIAIGAPKSVQILRKELLEVKEANVESAVASFDPRRLPKLRPAPEPEKPREKPAAPNAPNQKPIKKSDE